MTHRINAVGALRAPNYPKEYSNFKGPIIHSAEWNSKIDLEGKTVGIIGAGASAIQIIPEIAKVVKELHVYQRKAPYVNPRVQFEYPKLIQTIFNYFPFLMLIFRAFLFAFNDIFIALFKAGSKLNIFGKSCLNNYFANFAQLSELIFVTFLYIIVQKKNLQSMAKVIQDPVLEQSLTPDYKIGCKRILKSENYYHTMKRPNVKLHTSKIMEVDDYKVKTADGVTQNVDVRKHHFTTINH